MKLEGKTEKKKNGFVLLDTYKIKMLRYICEKRNVIVL